MRCNKEPERARPGEHSSGPEARSDARGGGLANRAENRAARLGGSGLAAAASLCKPCAWTGRAGPARRLAILSTPARRRAGAPAADEAKSSKRSPVSVR